MKGDNKESDLPPVCCPARQEPGIGHLWSALPSQWHGLASLYCGGKHGTSAPRTTPLWLLEKLMKTRMTCAGIVAWLEGDGDLEEIA